MFLLHNAIVVEPRSAAARSVAGVWESRFGLAAAQVVAMKSRTRSAKRSGSSRCGKWPAPSNSSTRHPGIDFCALIACHGGIIRSREQNGQSGVPWIRNIPLLGKLFSSSQKTGSRTELAIFITPTLVEDAGQIAEVAKADEARMAKATAEPQVDHRKP